MNERRRSRDTTAKLPFEKIEQVSLDEVMEGTVMNNHTPGQWHVEPTSYPERAHPQVYAGKKRIAEPCNSKDVPAPESDYNASLIAAAPDLFSALGSFLAAWDSGAYSPAELVAGLQEHGIVDDMRAAITKATTIEIV